MMFGIKYKDNRINKYLLTIEDRLTSDTAGFIFSGSLYTISSKNSQKAVIDLTPVFPKFYYFGVFLLILFISLSGFTAWLAIPLIFIASWLFYQPRLNYKVFCMGLKKEGVKEVPSYLAKEDLLRGFLENGTMGVVRLVQK